MKDTAPISEGIIAVSLLFAIIAAGVAFVPYDFGLFASVSIGAAVGFVAAVVLAVGWRSPAPGPDATRDAPTVGSTGASVRTATAAETTPAPATASPEPAAASAPTTPAPAPAAAPAVTEAPAVAADPVMPAATPEGGSKPSLLSEAREGGPDNLKEIKGVGPGLEKTLHEMGVYHFDQIASWGPAEEAWMDENLKGFKGRVSRDGWIEQAKLLASGGETEFSKKVEDGDVY